MNLPHDTTDKIWVHPDAESTGDGSFDEPYATLEAALAEVKPGQSIVLRAGEYRSDCNIEVRGTARSPIRIMAEPGAMVTIRDACWFLYDVSDLIVEGLTFDGAPYGAVSMLGRCSRNRFDALRFVNCGARRETACTMYIGGAGSGCNVVENCTFEHAPQLPFEGITAKNASVGLMIAHGDANGGDPVVNNLVRRNRFVNYGYGILLGGDESKNVRCGHIIEYNMLVGCIRECILVKSGDTIIRGNVLEKSAGNAITVQTDLDCEVEANRIVDCRRGIVVHGRGHTITGNCLVGCTDGAVWVGGATEELRAASNCFVDRNTFVNCSSAVSGEGTPVAGVLIDPGTTCIIERNLIVGAGKPYAFIERANAAQPEKPADHRRPVTQSVVRDNGAAGGCSLFDGFGAVAVEFVDAKNGFFTNASGFGADGWPLTPQGFDPAVDETDGDVDYREASIIEDDAGELIVPGEDIAGRGNLFGNFYAETEKDDEEGYDETSRYFAGGDE